jgi:hypothetical protein
VPVVLIEAEGSNRVRLMVKEVEGPPADRLLNPSVLLRADRLLRHYQKNDGNPYRQRLQFHPGPLHSFILTARSLQQTADHF